MKTRLHIKHLRFLHQAAAILLAAVIFAAILPMTVLASSYSASWKLWTQGQSSNQKMRKSGCRIVSYAKLLKDAGLAADASFNPDTFLYWCQHTYNPKQKCVFVFPGEVAQNGDAQDPIVTYNQKVGGNLVYAGRRYLTGKSAHRKQQVIDAVNEGYYVIIGGTAHFCYVDRELTKKYQKLWVDDSGVDYSALAFWNGNPNVYEVNTTICRHGMGAYDSIYLFYTKVEPTEVVTVSTVTAENTETQTAVTPDTQASATAQTDALSAEATVSTVETSVSATETTTLTADSATSTTETTASAAGTTALSAGATVPAAAASASTTANTVSLSAPAELLPAASVELLCFLNQPVALLQQLIPSLVQVDEQGSVSVEAAGTAASMDVFTSPLLTGSHKGCITAWTDAAGTVKNIQLTCSSTTQYAISGISSGMSSSDAETTLLGSGSKEILATTDVLGDGTSRQTEIFETPAAAQITTTSHPVGGLQIIDSITYVSTAG